MYASQTAEGPTLPRFCTTRSTPRPTSRATIKGNYAAYGTSDSPLGAIKVAKKPVILRQDPARQIYGPAHNSVIRIPATNDWRIVYHRINPAYLNDSPGIHREVCIDRLTINPDGTIAPVTPTN